MSFNRIGEDFYISGSVSAVSFYGDGSNLTGVIGVTGSAGTSGTSGINGVAGTSGTSGIDGVAGTSGTSGSIGPAGVSGTSGTSGVSGGGGNGATASDFYNSTRVVPYLLDGNAAKTYKFTRATTGSATTINSISGEKIFAQSFYAKPGEVINEICFRIMTAGAAGLGLAQVRFLIYRTKLNANGQITGGDLELDTNVNINTLSTGLKVVTGLNHTLSSNSYGNKWYMCLRNYQTGSLSIKMYTSGSIVTEYGEISLATNVMNRDLCWSWNVLWNDPTPAFMPAVSSGALSATAVTEFSTGVPCIGYSSF